MENAKFTLEKYMFDECHLSMVEADRNSTILMDFNPMGFFDSSKSTYELHFVFTAKSEKSDKVFVSVSCRATFKFVENIAFNNIPGYFYPNVIAIMFPYIRAFVSTLTLQSNIRPIVLPTLNLSSLQDKLKNNTEII